MALHPDLHPHLNEQDFILSPYQTQLQANDDKIDILQKMLHLLNGMAASSSGNAVIDYEQPMRTVWNDDGTGQELVQLFEWQDGVITGVSYTSPDGTPFTGAVTSPSAKQRSIPQAPVHNYVQGSSAGSVLAIPASLHYSIRVIDKDETATIDLMGGHEYLIDGTTGNTVPERGSIVIYPRVDGQPHPACSFTIPEGVVVWFEYVPF